jgi:hypothetical protein
LPGWMQFDSLTRSFSLSPGADVVGVTAQAFTVEVTATDGAGLQASDNFDVLVRPLGSGYDIQASVSFWKANANGQKSRLAGVELSKGAERGTSTELVGVSLLGVEDSDGADDGLMTINPQASSPSNARSAITLTDVLGALKVYLNKPLTDSFSSPLNFVAADFDGKDGVTLTDVLQLLKFYLNKPLTNNLKPEWVFVDAADFSADGKSFKAASGQNLSKTDTVPHPIDHMFDAGHEAIQIVGILRGDVDGSWSA